MKKIKQKFVYFLSDPSISDKDFKELLHWLKTGGIEEVEQKVNKIRCVIKNNIKGDIGYETRSDKYNHLQSPKNFRLDEIERLLIDDSNLSKKEAMAILADYFNLQFNSKNHIGFNKWIINLSNHVSWSEILHASHTIHNKKVRKEDENPWPLRYQND